MICVSIGRGRHKQTKAEHRALVEQGAKLVELRVDYINGSVNVKRLLQDRPCPVIITCRRKEDGGKWVDTEEKRLMLIRSAIADGCDYIDLEMDIAGKIPRFGKTKRIVSYHNFSETPFELEALHAKMAKLDPDIIKIATMAHSPHDNLRILSLIQQSRIPTVALCMGDIGTPSRILAGKFGAPFTYATFHHERTLAPGQLSYRQMIDIYDYDHIGTDTEVFGVIGDPIAHSLSPLIHNAAFRHLKMNRIYVPFRVPREDVAVFMRDCRDFGLKGLSVTIPHKEEVLLHLSKIDAAAIGIDAVNTVVFNGTESVGHNSDCRAAIESLLLSIGKSLDSEVNLAGRSALILGAGGAAKAIAYGLKQLGVEVVITSRTAARATDLATRLGCKSVEWEGREGLKPNILVNCTPVGLHPNVDESPIDKKALRRSMVVFDTVYNPEQTLLIKSARDAGARVVTGVEMFIRQAAIQFKLFTGVEAPVDVMRQEVKRAIGAAKEN